MLKGKKAQGSSSQHEALAHADVLPYPAGRECPAEVPMREHRRNPFQGPESGYHAVRPRRDLLGRLPAGAAVAEELPCGVAAEDLG